MLIEISNCRESENKREKERKGDRSQPEKKERKGEERREKKKKERQRAGPGGRCGRDRVAVEVTIRPCDGVEGQR